ncbi:hypothetical protein Taro_011841 [Colocasia esculenta]|uniref:Uncharacterized protein n=1 Tax=Colocasia esculenta TaxID=4460 RepID=A0A843UDU6_COLES|nr:hypothetical protein [Colocasia esculenta]
MAVWFSVSLDMMPCFAETSVCIPNGRFVRMLLEPNQPDGAWVEIYPSNELFITLGAEWLAERHVDLRFGTTSCVLQPPPEACIIPYGGFTNASELPPEPVAQDISMQDEIHEADASPINDDRFSQYPFLAGQASERSQLDRPDRCYSGIICSRGTGPRYNSVFATVLRYSFPSAAARQLPDRPTCSASHADNHSGQHVCIPNGRFVRMVLEPNHPDGAWVEIYPSNELFITLGAEWLAERHVNLRFGTTSCVLRPPPEACIVPYGGFTNASELPPEPVAQDISMQDEIHEADASPINEYEEEGGIGGDIRAWDQAIWCKSIKDGGDGQTTSIWLGDWPSGH